MNENGVYWTNIRTKGNNSSIYLNLIESGNNGMVKVSIYGLGGYEPFENCTYQADEYSLYYGKKYELVNYVKERFHSGVQLKFKGNKGQVIKGEWSPDYIPEKDCIKIAGDDTFTTISQINDFDLLIDVPIISQKPEFLYACESVSAVMLLNYYGYNISVREFIDKYLIKKPISENADPHSAFYGDPYGGAYGCFASVIKKSMNKFLDRHKALVLKGEKFENLVENYLEFGNPILIWATIGMKKPVPGRSWIIKYVDENATTNVGDLYVWMKHEHCLVLVGYNDNNYIVNDPYQEKSKVLGQYEKKLLEKRYYEMGSEALILKSLISNNFNLTSNENQIISKLKDFSKGLGVQILQNEIDPIFMVIGSFKNNFEIESILNSVKLLNIQNHNFYLLGKITGDIISVIKGIIETIFGIGMIIGGIGTDLLSGITMGPLVTIPVLVVSYSAVTAGSALAVQGYGVIRSSVSNLKNDLFKFIKNKNNKGGNYSEREISVEKAESKVWKNLKTYKGKTKMSGKGNKIKYYQWDNLHNEIEVYDRNGRHLGTMCSKKGKMIKPAVKGRKIDI